MASPNAISTNTENKINPATPCIAKIDNNSELLYSANIAAPHLDFKLAIQTLPAEWLVAFLNLLITFRERIWLDQLFGFEDHIVLTIRTCVTDTGFGPEVMVGVNFYITFRCSRQLDTG